MTVKIIGVGRHLPPFMCNNDQVADLLGGNYKGKGNLIKKLVGTENRHVASFTEDGLPDLKYYDEMEEEGIAFKAAQMAMVNASCSPDDIGLFIYVSGTYAQSKEFSTKYLRALNKGAKNLHYKLGLQKNTSAEGRDRACAGFLSAIIESVFHLENPRFPKDKKVLIVTSNDAWLKADRELYRETDAVSSLMVFGSGAGAFVLGDDEREGGVIGFCHLTDSDPKDTLISLVPGITSTSRAFASRIENVVVSKSFVPGMTEIIKILTDAHPEALNPDLFLLHQPNYKLMDGLITALETNSSKVPLIVQDVGNVSGAFTPILYAKCLAEGKIQSGNRIIFASIGEGERAAVYYQVP